MVGLIADAATRRRNEKETRERLEREGREIIGGLLLTVLANATLEVRRSVVISLLLRVHGSGRVALAEVLADLPEDWKTPV